MERLIRKDKNGRERFTDIQSRGPRRWNRGHCQEHWCVGTEKLHFLGPTSRLAMRRRVPVLKPCGTMSTLKGVQVMPMLANKWEERQQVHLHPLLRSTQTGWGSPPRFQGWMLFQNR